MATATYFSEKNPLKLSYCRLAYVNHFSGGWGFVEQACWWSETVEDRCEKFDSCYGQKSKNRTVTMEKHLDMMKAKKRLNKSRGSPFKK